jgi:transposase-like protein
MLRQKWHVLVSSKGPLVNMLLSGNYIIHTHLGHRDKLKAPANNLNTVSMKEIYKIKQEVKQKELAGLRRRWFSRYKQVGNVAAVCRELGIHRSRFYYWKKRLATESSGKGKGYAKGARLLAYSTKPKSSPRNYSEEWVDLIKKIRKRTRRGAEQIWFILRDKYGIFVSVTGVYKVLKRAGLIKHKKGRKKELKSYEAPKYLPGEKIQIDVKYVKLFDFVAKRCGKVYRWVYQYTALDVATGIKCKLIYENHDPQASVDFLSRVRLFYPFPIKVIQTDNGFEFTYRMNYDVKKTHIFTHQCKIYGYEHNLIPPAYPRANSHVERTHRIDQEEVYQTKTFQSLAEATKINLKSLKYFNEKRPQKSKHFLSPLKFGILNYQLTKQKLNYSVLNV